MSLFCYGKSPLMVRHSALVSLYIEFIFCKHYIHANIHSCDAKANKEEVCI